MTGYGGDIHTLRIDLNRLRGESIVTRRDFAEDSGYKVPQFKPGELVRVVEEEGDAYLANVERVDGMLVYLRIDLKSWTPAIENIKSRSGYTAVGNRPQVSKPLTRSALVPA